MAEDHEGLIYVPEPKIEFATNTFVNVPTILQYDDEPLIQMIKEEQAGYTSNFRIFNEDGIKLAAVRGSRMFLTEDGSKANLHLEHPDRMTVCKLGNQILFEVRRKEAAALHTEAELYTPDGSFVKANPALSGLVNSGSGPLQIGGVMMEGNTFSGCQIGVHVKSDGSFSIGVA